MKKDVTHSKDAFRLTGFHVLAMFVVFFGVIIAVNFSMAALASRTWTGLIVKNSYVASQEFNSTLQQAKAQNARGWASRISYRDGVLAIEIVDQNENFLETGDLEVQIGRPAFEQSDLALKLRPETSGKYTTSLALSQGEWAMVITTFSAHLPYRREARLIIDSSGNGKVQ